MLKKMMVVGFILLGGYVESASAQDAAMDAVQNAIDEAGRLRIVEIKNRIKSQREEIRLALANKRISPDRAKDCGNILDKVESQVKITIANGDGTMLTDDYDNYSSFLDVNASLIGNQDHVTVASKRNNSNS